jgi:hypothetical protein
MFKPKRKNHYPSFARERNMPQAVLLAGIFGLGFWISSFVGFRAVAGYLLLWVISYPVIYAGACRYCAYYGKKCPIPLEGSCVQYFFTRSEKPFGYTQLFWALVAYFLRMAVPVAAIVIHAAYFPGLILALLLTVFWIVHLRAAGCPNCVNVTCPLNPSFPPPLH